jgi:hypothetical protein
MNPLQPCCVGDLFCGSVACDKPELTFFWDGFHPSQNGWYAVYQMVQSSLPQIFEEKKANRYKILCPQLQCPPPFSKPSITMWCNLLNIENQKKKNNKE